MAKRSTARRRTEPRRPEPRRRSALVIVIVVIAALALAVTLIPGALTPPAALSCPYGEVILNGVDQCAPSPGQ